LFLLAFDEISAVARGVPGHEIRAVPGRIPSNEIARTLRPGILRIACELSKRREAYQDPGADEDNFTHRFCPMGEV
jgi:hypothetical protein